MMVQTCGETIKARGVCEYTESNYAATVIVLGAIFHCLCRENDRGAQRPLPRRQTRTTGS